MTHTPGPWFYDIGTSSLGFSGGWIARIVREGEGLGKNIDDAHLIAAAPELLDALKAITEVVYNDLINSKEKVSISYLEDVCRQANQAIAKVEGGE